MDAKAYGVPEAQPVRPESAARSSVPRPSLQSSVGNSALARIFEGSDPEQRVRHRAQQATGVDLSSVLLRTGSALPGAIGVEAVSLEPVLQRLNELIAPASGHPFQGLILSQKPKADALVGKLVAGAR